uniref:Uncharacterized protein n=1 Tax=Tetranychus urticae TaxID=32264 RepID=T1KGS0_TETUR
MMHHFQKAKIIPPPKELPNHKIINVNWVHSALFQVAFIHNSSTSNPDTRVVFIHAPPKATIEYYDFGSVCMETSQYGGPDKIQFCFSQIGNILLCLSSISSEVALIGCDAGEINPIPNQWSQWILDDTSRIELQPDANNVESSPCGISWFKGPTKTFRVNESVSFGGPGWPLVVILSSAGVLCPYYAYHNQGKLIIPDFPVSQPLPITLPPPARISSSEVQLSGQQSAPQIPISKSSAQPFQIQPSQAADASFTFSLSKSAQPKPQTTLSVSATIQAPGQSQQQPQSVPPNSSQPPKPTQQQRHLQGNFANANTPSFGALASQQTPSFGQLASTTQPVPAQQQQPATGSLFGGFSQTSAPSMAKPAEAASPFSSFSSAPSFGALASQQAPSFGQLASTAQPVPAQQQQQQQKPATGSLFGGFGQANVSSSSSIFGNTFPSAPVFGSPQFSQRRQ